MAVAYLESLDVDEMHERTRRTFQDTPLWAFEHDRLTQVNGAPPSSAAVQLGLEIQMYAFCPAWRFTQQTLTAIVTIKGIALPVQKMLNHTAHILLSRNSQLRHNDACQRAWFFETRLALSMDPSNTGACRYDNFTDNHGGSSASHGERRGERVTVGASCRPPTRDRPSKNTQKNCFGCAGSDAMWTPWYNAPKRDAFKLEPGTRAWTSNIDEPLFKDLLKMKPLRMAQRLEAYSGERITYKLLDHVFLQRQIASSDAREYHTKIERKKRRERYTQDLGGQKRAPAARASSRRARRTTCA